MNLLGIKIKEISNFLENGRLDEAEVKIIQYLNTSPHTAEVLLQYGTIKAIQKKYIEAANILESAIKLNPKIAAAYNNLGNVNVELKEY
jgi:tetratricopeptide (TPR) repeat protein